MKKFYLDTCIWLNLFKKEGDSFKGIPYWKIAEDFIEKIEKTNSLILFSKAVLKELYYKLKEKNLAKEFFNKKDYIVKIDISQEDYYFARKLESELGYKISFLDCLHIAISKRVEAILITRDKLLIKYAKKYVKVKKPEELF